MLQFIIPCVKWSLLSDLFCSILFLIHHVQNTLAALLYIELPNLDPISETPHLLFLLPRTPPSDLHIIASSLGFQHQCFDLWFPFLTTLPKNISSITICHFTLFNQLQSTWNYLCNACVYYLLPYLPLLRCKPLTIRNYGLITTIYPNIWKEVSCIVGSQKFWLIGSPILHFLCLWLLSSHCYFSHCSVIFSVTKETGFITQEK